MPLPTADDLRDVATFIRRCFRRLALVLDRPWTLVLDNIQELDRAPTLHAGVAAAICEPPPAEYARPLAAQQMTVIDAGNLRFTAEETRALLHLHDRPWSAEALCEATAGWAAAMILLLAARTELGSQASVRDGGTPERLFDLFAGEVMETLATWERDALLRIAFLPSATPALAITLGREPRAGRLLDNLARRSLFTDRRGGESPVYTFHALFGEFLRAQDARQFSSDALRALRIEAADLRQPDAEEGDRRGLGRDGCAAEPQASRTVLLTQSLQS